MTFIKLICNIYIRVTVQYKEMNKGVISLNDKRFKLFLYCILQSTVKVMRHFSGSPMLSLRLLGLRRKEYPNQPTTVQRHHPKMEKKKCNSRIAHKIMNTFVRNVIVINFYTFSSITAVFVSPFHDYDFYSHCSKYCLPECRSLRRDGSTRW